MNRYNARKGVSYKVSETKTPTKPSPAMPKKQGQRECSKNPAKQKDMGDIWVLAVFFLLYLESRDTDFLIILAVLAFSMFDMGGILKKFGVAL